MNEEIKVVVVKYPDRTNLVMRYVDPMTGRQVTRSAKTTQRRKAERKAAKWEAELQEGRYKPDTKITWADFRERYENEKLASLKARTEETCSAAFNHLERIIDPARLASITSETLSHFQSELRKAKLKDTSIAIHLRHIRAALSWAVSMKFLAEVPNIEMPKRAKAHKLMRGRPITAEEFERMLAVVPKVRKADAETWKRYLNGLWLSGLRLEESTILSWDEDAPLSIDLTGKHPRLRIYREAEKGGQDRLLPLTPDFAEWILETPKDERIGSVMPIIAQYTGQRMTAKRVGRVISEIGKKAKVVVNKSEGKYASAHDLRRAFGTRWSSKVKPVTLQLLMRHRSIETTLKYYVDQDADDVAAELWAQHQSRDTSQVTV